MANRQYVGARYVPKFADPVEWSSALSYEALTIVTHLGNSFTSKKPVPAGVDIGNTEYWVNTGNYNEQIEQYRNDVANLSARFNNIAFINVVEAGCDNTGVSDCTDKLNELINQGKNLYFPAGTYSIQKYVKPISGCTIIGDNAKLVGGANDKFMFLCEGVNGFSISGFDVSNMRRFIDTRNNCNNITIKNITGHDPYRNPDVKDCFFMVIQDTTDIIIENIKWNSTLANSDGIRLKNNIKNAIIKNFSGTSGDDFFAIVTDEDAGGHTIENVLIENCECTNTFCGARLQTSLPNSHIKNVTFKNCQFDVTSVEAVRLCTTNTANHADGVGPGNISNVKFDNCTFKTNSSYATVKIETITADKILFNNCTIKNETFNRSFAISYSTGNITIMNSAITCPTGASIREDNSDIRVNSINNTFESKNANFYIQTKMTLYCVSSTLQGSEGILNLGEINAFLSNNRCSTDLVRNNGSAAYISGGGNTCPVDVVGNGTLTSICGDLRSSQSPTTGRIGDHYIHINSNIATQKIYTNGDWA